MGKPRNYEDELLAHREAMNSQIRKMIARKEQLQAEIEGTKRTVATKRVSIAAREAGLRKGVPVEWVRDQVQPEEDGSYDPAKIREWAEEHKLTADEPKRNQGVQQVGSPPISTIGELRSGKSLGRYVSEDERREQLKGGRFTPERRPK